MWKKRTLRSEFDRALERGHANRAASREKNAAEPAKIAREKREFIQNSINNDLKQAAKNLKKKALADAQEGHEQGGIHFMTPENKKLGLKSLNPFDSFLFDTDSPYHTSIEDMRRMPGYAALDKACQKADMRMEIRKTGRDLDIIIHYKEHYKTPMCSISTLTHHSYEEASPMAAGTDKTNRVPPLNSGGRHPVELG